VQILSNGRGHKNVGTAEGYEFVCQLRLELILRLKNNNETATGTPGRQFYPKYLSNFLY
jgi:hypothetical protein